MTFDDILAGLALFVDANPLVYHFSAHPKYGAACTRLVERIERQEVQGFTSAHVLADVAHRLMTIEAMNLLGWPATGLAARLRQHHAEIPRLTLYQQALVKLGQMGVQVLPITDHLILAAANYCQQYELLTGDALVVAVMRHHGLTHLASGDADFDRVLGLTRYAPT
jgi:predicted nucleic acid-binding protein